jgi:hypothetical protein
MQLEHSPANDLASHSFCKSFATPSYDQGAFDLGKAVLSQHLAVANPIGMTGPLA